MTRELLAILNACHDVGLVYRDVKPDNIILVDCGQPKRRPLPGHLPLRGDGSRAQVRTHARTAAADLEVSRARMLPRSWSTSPFRFACREAHRGRQSLKQDVRSDLSFAAGIFHYLLGDRHPDILQDGGRDLLGDLALGRSGRSPDDGGLAGLDQEGQLLGELGRAEGVLCGYRLGNGHGRAPAGRGDGTGNRGPASGRMAGMGKAA